METLWKRILSQQIHIFAQRVHSKVPIFITINKLKSFAHVEGQLMSQLMPSPRGNIVFICLSLLRSNLRGINK